MSDSSLGKWISLLYRYGQIYMAKELEPYQIGKGQFLFLLMLYQKDGLLQEELAQCLNIDKGTTARAISKLEKAGYLLRERNKDDLRANRIFLTKQGRELKPQISAAICRWTEIISANMTDEEVKIAFNVLTKMAHNATEHIVKQRK